MQRTPRKSGPHEAAQVTPRRRVVRLSTLFAVFALAWLCALGTSTTTFARGVGPAHNASASFVGRTLRSGIVSGSARVVDHLVKRIDHLNGDLASTQCGVLPLARSYHGALATVIASGIPTGQGQLNSCSGAFGLAFLNGLMYVQDQYHGLLYRLALSGDRANNSLILRQPPGAIDVDDLAVGRHGALYALQPNTSSNTLCVTCGIVVQLDPRTGHVTRTVARLLCNPAWIAVNPVTGDLFVGSGGDQSDFSPDIWQIHDVASRHPVVSVFYQGEPLGFTEMAFSPNGSLYAVTRGDQLVRLDRSTSLHTVTETHLVSLPPQTDALALGPVSARGVPQWVYVGGQGNIVKVALPSGRQTLLVSGTSDPITMKIGPGGCLFAPSSNLVYEITNADGTCPVDGRNHSLPWSSTVPSMFSAFKNGGKDVASLSLAAGAVLLITFPSELFNLTFEEHYDEIYGWWTKRQRRLRSSWRRLFLRQGPDNHATPTSGPSRPPDGAKTSPHEVSIAPPTVAAWARPSNVTLVIAIGALLATLLHPNSGFDLATLSTYVGIALALVASLGFVALALAGFRRWRKMDVSLHLHALPYGLVIAALCVAISRLTDFQPGYLYGVVCGVVLAKNLPKSDEARVVATSSLATLSVSILAWFLWSEIDPSIRLLGYGLGFFAHVVDTFLATLFVAGIVNTTIGLLPVALLPGRSLLDWRKWAWFGAFFLSIFGVAVLLIDSPVVYSGSLVTIILLFVIFGIGSVAFREYFLRRWRAVHHEEVHGLRSWIIDLFRRRVDETTELMSSLGATQVVLESVNDSSDAHLGP